MAKYCKNCGYQMEDSAVFCMRCGQADGRALPARGESGPAPDLDGRDA